MGAGARATTPATKRRDGTQLLCNDERKERANEGHPGLTHAVIPAVGASQGDVPGGVLPQGGLTGGAGAAWPLSDPDPAALAGVLCGSEKGAPLLSPPESQDGIKGTVLSPG